MTKATGTATCPTCGNNFEPNPLGRKKLYCSRKCTAYEQQKTQKRKPAKRPVNINNLDLQSTCEEWINQAYCKQNNLETNSFFPGRGGNFNIETEASKACNQCTVTQQCLAYALRNEIRYGVWGGTSERQRRALRRQMKLAAHTP